MMAAKTSAALSSTVTAKETALIVTPRTQKTKSIITEKHLNGSKLHLNKRGTVILSNTFTEAISNSIYWHCFRHSLKNSRVSNTITCDEFNAKKPKENTYLNFIRKGNLNRLVLAHVNVNSIRNKFDTLVQQITNNTDILMISETKLDNSFPEGQFLIPGYSSPYRFERNCRGGGIMLYVREDIPSKLLSIENQPIKDFYVEINFRK